MPKQDAELLRKITKRGVAEIIPEAEFVKRLEEGKPLRLKMGFDPSRPDLHLGHVVGLRKLRQLQELGHQVILVVGDWTAQIGDPSGQSDTRTMLTADQVKENAETYMRQFFKIVDPAKTQAVYQSEWFGKFTLADVIKLTSLFTVNQFLHRDDFAKRYAAERPIAVTELLYPLMQAYDSVAIQADVEFGGTDQMFNLLVGRELQEKMGQRPQQCFLMPILPGTDGVRKMSKSLNNYIAIDDAPKEMFGKVMSLPDNLIALYFELLTDMPDDELAELRHALEVGAGFKPAPTIKPMDVKKRLATEIVAQFHSVEAAEAERAEFERVFQQREAPSEVLEIAVTPETDGVVRIEGNVIVADLSRLLVAANLAKSRGEARRLIQQGAVEIDGSRAPRSSANEPSPFNLQVNPRIPYGALIRVGPHRFVRVVKGR